jgi:hypothetical protein
VTAAQTLVEVLRDPARAMAIDLTRWTELLTVARAETLAGTLAHRLEGLAVPDAVAKALAEARIDAAEARRTALWEANRIAKTLRPLAHPVVLLKGTAFVAAGLAAGQGRGIGDCDILLPRPMLDHAEKLLIDAGWQWIKPDPYDDLYYRRWMHELPPLIHAERGRMVDVHHTILPLTARQKPDAQALIADAVPLDGGLAVLDHADMIVHAAAHLFADGELAGGLRNLWDIHALIEERGLEGLEARAARHGLSSAVERALRLSHALYGTSVPRRCRHLSATDRLYRRRMIARDGWGRERYTALRTAFYIRSHLIRMPLPLLARHLWIKWRKGKAASASG